MGSALGYFESNAKNSKEIIARSNGGLRSGAVF